MIRCFSSEFALPVSSAHRRALTAHLALEVSLASTDVVARDVSDVAVKGVLEPAACGAADESRYE